MVLLPYHVLAFVRGGVSIYVVPRTSFDKLIVYRDNVMRILLDMCMRKFVRFYIPLIFF